MGALDLLIDEVGTRFAIGDTKAGSLLSGLLALINQQKGGLSGLLDRFRAAGFNDSVSSWLRGDAKSLSANQLEAALGHSTIDSIASKAGVPFSAASSALAFMLPKLVERLAPGGLVPTHLPAGVMSYISGPTATLASGARQTVQAVERAVESPGLPRWLWPVLALVGILLLGLWLWNRREPVQTAAFNVEEQVRLASQKALAALTALRPGFTSQELVGALNFNIINFASGSAQLPGSSYDFLNQAAIAIKAASPGTTIEIAGHTDNTGDAASNMQLSQQRADSVREYLVKQGVDPAVVIAKGYGDTRPIAPNDSEEGKFRNRRIEFSVVR